MICVSFQPESCTQMSQDDGAILRWSHAGFNVADIILSAITGLAGTLLPHFRSDIPLAG